MNDATPKTGGGTTRGYGTRPAWRGGRGSSVGQYSQGGSGGTGGGGGAGGGGGGYGIPYGGGGGHIYGGTGGPYRGRGGSASSSVYGSLPQRSFGYGSQSYQVSILKLFCIPRKMVMETFLWLINRIRPILSLLLLRYPGIIRLIWDVPGEDEYNMGPGIRVRTRVVFLD